MTRRLLVCIAVTIAFATATVAPASAQTKPASKPGTERAMEFLIGGLVTAPTSVGSATAELLDGSGNSSVDLFHLDNKLGMGFGVEANLGFQIGRALWLEVSGGWTKSNVESEIRDDFEDAFDETISSAMSRFTLQGGVLRYFHDSGSSAWFLRGIAGWLRETAGGNTLTGDGIIAGGGVGWRHWWVTSRKGAANRVGLRVEGRADVRSGGISLGEKGIRFGPAGVAHLVFGF
jgi:hypothetical protein